MRLPDAGDIKQKPTFCPECHAQNCFERDAEHDIKTPEGEVIEQRWKCRGCGHTTLRPYLDDDMVGVY